MMENLQLKRLPKELFDMIELLWKERGPIRFLNPSPHIGFDIFDEEQDQPTASAAAWD